MTSSAGGSGGASRYNSQVATKVTENTSGVNPFIEVTYTSASQGGGTQVTTNTIVSGSTSDTLTIQSDRVGIQTVRCVIKHPNSALSYDQSFPDGTSGHAGVGRTSLLSGGKYDGGLTTLTRNFETISAVNQSRSMITHEIVQDTDVTVYTTSTQNLFLGPLNLQATTAGTFETRAIMIFPEEENLTVKIYLSGSKGQDWNGNSGGEGGKTIFTYTLQKDTEYCLKLGPTVEPTSSIGRGGAGAYFYEKGRLLVACGGGGASGWYGGSGGDGGGAGVAGGAGSGSGGGNGGQKVNDGQLTAAGLLPSGTTGGKIESCTTGSWWNTQGYSPCSDVGTTKFRDCIGQEVVGSHSILRGYKSADVTTYGYRTNGGNSSSLGANGQFVGGGGSGAFGGNAASDASSGGGGASGYSNGSVTIVSSQQGGSISEYASAVIEIV